MDFVEDVHDYGEAPEFHVTGFSRVTRVSSSTARIALFVEHELDEGRIERRVVAYLLCDLEGMAAAHALFAEAITALEKAVPLNKRTSRQPSPRTH